MIWILTYFIIGFVVALIAYDYHCKDCKKNYPNFTWEQYSKYENPILASWICAMFWPGVIICTIVCYISEIPFKYIRKRNGL